jgi:2-polyprenyl-3-methyl-5-hydroxy-6-metoxy-1,4-benzoquinol methylase
MAISIIFILSCNFSKDSSAVDPILLEELKESNIGRSSWQKPNLVIEKLGNIEGKTIADIGAGTGYFSFRLAFNGAKVIAIEIDPKMIELIETFDLNLPADLHGKIETRLAKPDDPLLSPSEVDIVFIMNTIAYIENPADYLKRLKSGMKPNGAIMIVDFKTKNLDINAPPMDERISPSVVLGFLENAGFSKIVLDDSSLDYQYIITASL